ncbi:MAG: ATP-binding protein [Treponema sp.]|jgi:predicted AAA+ superfamily ATPase|nr:ATP-binding protein [Treponema sp.]
MINRPEYLKKLLAFKDKQLIKIVTGVRRCGKSTLFELYQNELLRLGVRSEQIQSINLEEPNYRELLDWEKLYYAINNRLIKNKQNYIFLDEIQNVKDFQRAADGLFIKKNVDLYLAGSNSKMQSGEWATLLSGRYVDIHMFPLSFKEYVAAENNVSGISLDKSFAHYVEFGSFPFLFNFRNFSDNALSVDKLSVRDYLSGIYSIIVLKDIVENKKIKDAGRLELVIKFMADSIGSETSIKRISDMLTSDGIKILPLTVESYLDAFRDSYILYKADRYDVKGRKLLKTLNKYYMVDMGLRRLLLGDKAVDSGHILENIVYLELLRRGYKVYIGKVDNKEVDFAVERPDGVEYYQVSETVRGKETLARELAPLELIRDHNPKFLLTRDYELKISHNGIKQINALEWLLGDNKP